MDYVPPTTNLQRPRYELWKTYTKGLETPLQYVDFGFYALVSAALQRRVWIPRGTRECYPNQFIMLAGNPAIGKSSIIDPLCDMLKFHVRMPNQPASKKGEVNAAEAFKDMDPTMLPPDQQPKQLFPTPPDSSSLRALTNHLARCVSTFKTGLDKPKLYMHCSSAYFLGDLVSLFKQSSETGNISDFLLKAWDCGNYTHSTFNNGEDIIMRCCVTMLAGVQPDVMKDIFDDRLVKSGFLSRCIFVYADKPRERVWSDDTVTPEQQYAYENIREYLKELAELFGPVKFTPEASLWMKEWHEKQRDAERVNSNSKLDHYYGRKDMHIMKLAMAIHFAESKERTLDASELQLAHAMLAQIESEMHLAFGNKGTNPLHLAGVEILRYLKHNGPTTETELLIDFGDTLREIELKEVLLTLVNTGKAMKFADKEDTKVKYKVVL